MTSRSIFILLFVFGAAYFMAACAPGDTVPGVCFYDATAQDADPCNGLGEKVTCREQHVGASTDCANGLIEPPYSCSEGVAVAIPGLDCPTAANYPGQPQVPLYSKCTMSDGVDYYGYGDCTVGVAPESICTAAGGTFECLL